MKVSDYYFDLPENLIAQKPIDERSSSKLLCVHNDNFNDRVFSELPEILSKNDLLVLNNTKVMPSRLFGIKSTGGKVEILLERILDKDIALVQTKSNKNRDQSLIDPQQLQAMGEIQAQSKEELQCFQISFP